MSEWKNGYFLDYIELNPKVVLKKGDLYPFVDMASVDSITRIPISIELKQYTSGVKFQELDTVFARIEPCLQNGKRFLFKDFSSGFGSTEFLVFRAIKNKTTPLFVYYYMQTHRIKNIMINSMTGATGRQRVNNDVFNHLTVKIPSLSIQNRIAEILSRYDSLIENYQKQIKLLEESAQRLYKEWFVDLRFPGHENTKIVDGVPEGWEKMCLGELVCFKRGKTITKKEIIEGNIPVVAGGTEPAYYCNKSNTGNRVITISASGANAGYTRMYFEEIWASDCSFIDCSMTNCFHFIYCYLIANKIAIDNLQKGAAQPHVYPKDINALTLCCPHNDILDSFESKISYYFDLISSLQNQIALLTEARDRLLPKLMSGEIEV